MMRSPTPSEYELAAQAEGQASQPPKEPGELPGQDARWVNLTGRPYSRLPRKHRRPGPLPPSPASLGSGEARSETLEGTPTGELAEILSPETGQPARTAGEAAAAPPAAVPPPAVSPPASANALPDEPEWQGVFQEEQGAGNFRVEPRTHPFQQPGSPAVRISFERSRQAASGPVLERAAASTTLPDRSAPVTLPPPFCSAALAEEHTLLAGLAQAAGMAPSESEAASLAVACVPITLRLQPDVYRALWPVMPALVVGVDTLSRVLYRQPGSQLLLLRLPQILILATRDLANFIRDGLHLEPIDAAGALAQRAEQVLSLPPDPTTTRNR